MTLSGWAGKGSDVQTRASDFWREPRWTAVGVFLPCGSQSKEQAPCLIFYVRLLALGRGERDQELDLGRVK